MSEDRAIFLRKTIQKRIDNIIKMVERDFPEFDLKFLYAFAALDTTTSKFRDGYTGIYSMETDTMQVFIKDLIDLHQELVDGELDDERFDGLSAKDYFDYTLKGKD